MNSAYLYEYAASLERVLSTGYKLRYSANTLQRMISYSSFFQTIENDYLGLVPLRADKFLIEELFPKEKIVLDEVPVYVPCLWASEAYLRIQGETGLTFEAIFLYLPIKKMYEYFPIYHEMDFSKIIQSFNEIYEKQSVLSLLIKKYEYSLKDIARRIDVSYNTLYSVKKRRRNIKEMNIETIVHLSKIFNVRIETIAEIRLKQK